MKHRTTSNIPDWVARIVAAIIFLGFPAACQYIPVLQAWHLPFWSSVACAGVAALVVGFFVLRFCEWLENAHLDSVETKNRFGFGTMVLTAVICVATVAAVVLQWQKA